MNTSVLKERAGIKWECSRRHPGVPQPTWERGLGVGSRPPPGSSPATALAGAKRDKALVSSGMTPAGKQPGIRVHPSLEAPNTQIHPAKSPWYTTWVCWKYLCWLKYKAWWLLIFSINFFCQNATSMGDNLTVPFSLQKVKFLEQKKIAQYTLLCC